MGWEVGGRFRRTATYVCLWPIYVDVWQKAIQHCKAFLNKVLMKENHMKGLLTEIWARLMLPTSLKSSRWAGNMSTAISRLMSTPTGHLYPGGVWLEIFLHHLLDFFVVLSNFVFLFFSQYCLRMVWPSGEIWTWGFLGIPGLEIITPASPCHIWMHVPHRACT